MTKNSGIKVGFVSHGCPKNLVDTEWMMGLLKNDGYNITLDENDCDIVVVNTCAFINDAEKESVQSILRLVNKGKQVVVAGCLAQKYSEQLKEIIPEIKGIIGVSDISKISDAVSKITKKQDYINKICDIKTYNFPQKNVERQLSTIGASAYLKISEGCNCECGYCIIPKLRGKQVSRPMEDIIEEAKFLVSRGIVEIILIAQDTTAYGSDLYGCLKLPELLEKLNNIKDLQWIRVMYAYPSHVTDELLYAMQKCKKVVKYLDLPLQHSNKNVLISMRRPAFDYEKLIKKIREIIPQIALRSTMIVGYPGETEEQFEDLLNFIRHVKFDKLGVFEYCREKGTYSYNLKGQISKKIKHERYKKLMEAQQLISKQKNKSRIGDIIECLIVAETDDNVLVMRSQYDAPEIDGIVYAKKILSCVPGDIVYVKITDVDEYDLFGVVIKNGNE